MLNMLIFLHISNIFCNFAAEKKILNMSKTKSKKFNIFTRDGENKIGVETPYPMTLDEAQSYFNCLSIGRY